jgi:hypothetical protein
MQDFELKLNSFINVNDYFANICTLNLLFTHCENEKSISFPVSRSEADFV